MDGDKVWTTRQLAEEAARRGRPLSRERIRQLCAAGEIEANKPGRDWLVPDHAAQAWLADFTNTSDDRPG